jgi:hypothetical protein
MATKKAPAAKAKTEKTESVASPASSYTYTSFNYFNAAKTDDGKKLPGQLRKVADKSYKLNMKLDLGDGEKFYDIALPSDSAKTSDGKPQWFKKNPAADAKIQRPMIFIANEVKLTATEHVLKADAEKGVKGKSIEITPSELRDAVIKQSKAHSKAAPVAEPTATKTADKSMEK